MKLLINIAWRNIWRNRQRSIVMIVAIAAGLWGGLMATSIMVGLVSKRFETGIEQHVSHVQVNHPEFLIDQNVEFYIDEWEALRSYLDNTPEVVAYSGRTLVSAMLATANLTSGVQIIGIDPRMETQTSALGENIIEGSYFEEELRNPLLIGKRLADKVKARPGSRIVLTFQDINNELTSTTFRVAGIFQTANSLWDEHHIFVLHDNINEYIGYDNQVNAVHLLLDDHRLSADVTAKVQKAFPSLEVRMWAEIAPELAFLNEMAGFMMYIILTIILMALAFGLLNTMLMSVFERVKELGMLMAIGMNKRKLFSMIMLETVFLALSGAVAGMLATWASVRPLGRSGMDLTVIGGDSLADLGFDAVVHPQLDLASYVGLTLQVIVCAVLTAVYPAMKALRLKPAEAVKGL
ncbi:MAG: FtsX-like permease family protein [Bacteroidales bacterium]|nr:FtsX-like permease family protein [Bacteroidales bacterium]